MTQFYLEAFQWHGVKRGESLRVLRRRHQREGAASVQLQRREPGHRAPAQRDVHRQHRAASRHRRGASGDGARRDRAGGVYHASERRLDDVRQAPELRRVALAKLISFDIDGTLEVGDPPGYITIERVREAHALRLHHRELLRLDGQPAAANVAGARHHGLVHRAEAPSRSGQGRVQRRASTSTSAIRTWIGTTPSGTGSRTSIRTIRWTISGGRPRQRSMRGGRGRA